MAMKYQKGTVYPSGKKVKMWYGKYLIYGKDKDGKEVRKHRNVAICPKAGTSEMEGGADVAGDDSEGDAGCSAEGDTAFPRMNQ